MLLLEPKALLSPRTRNPRTQKKKRLSHFHRRSFLHASQRTIRRTTPAPRPNRPPERSQIQRPRHRRRQIPQLHECHRHRRTRRTPQRRSPALLFPAFHRRPVCLSTRLPGPNAPSQATIRVRTRPRPAHGHRPVSTRPPHQLPGRSHAARSRYHRPRIPGARPVRSLLPIEQTGDPRKSAQAAQARRQRARNAPIPPGRSESVVRVP